MFQFPASDLVTFNMGPALSPELPGGLSEGHLLCNFTYWLVMGTFPNKSFLHKFLP